MLDGSVAAQGLARGTQRTGGRYRIGRPRLAAAPHVPRGFARAVAVASAGFSGQE